MKTAHVLLAVAAAGALYYWHKNRTQSVASQPAASAAVPGVIQKPLSEASQIIKIPSDLLTNTSGNTGIMPPVLAQQLAPIKTLQPAPVKVSATKYQLID